ncbi:putative/putative single-stranded DNA-binding protein [Bacillus smithii]|nr:putative/putative single-stranded DNA-binding protein [Bacillus smithii]
MRRLKRETKFGGELNLIMMTKLVVFNKGHRKKSLSISEKQEGEGLLISLTKQTTAPRYRSLISLPYFSPKIAIGLNASKWMCSFGIPHCCNAD